jgi:hypothetical protein
MLACIIVKEVFGSEGVELLYKAGDILKGFKLPDDAPDELKDTYEICSKSEFKNINDTFKFYDVLSYYDPTIGFNIVDGFVDDEECIFITPFPHNYSNMYVIVDEEPNSIYDSMIDVIECERVRTDETGEFNRTKEWFKRYGIDWTNPENESIELKWINIKSGDKIYKYWINECS